GSTGVHIEIKIYKCRRRCDVEMRDLVNIGDVSRIADPECASHSIVWPNFRRWCGFVGSSNKFGNRENFYRDGRRNCRVRNPEVIFIGALSLIEYNRASTCAIAIGPMCVDEYTRAKRKCKQQKFT